MTKYTKELGQIIADRVSAGELVYKICEDPAIGVTKTAVYSWSARHPEFGKLFSDALIRRAENWGEGIIEDIERCPERPEAIAKMKMMTDTKRWIMGKLLKNYSDRVTIQGDKDNPIAITLAHALDDRIAAYQANRTIDHVASEVMTLPVLPVMDVESVDE